MSDTTTETTKDAGWNEAAAASAAAEATAKHPPRKFTERLMVKLSKNELIERGALLADKLLKVTALEDEKKASTERIKARITDVQGEADDLAAVIRAGKEERDVECIEEFVFSTNTATTRRADTGEIVSTRALTSQERQPELPLQKNGKGETFDAQGVLVPDAPPSSTDVAPKRPRAHTPKALPAKTEGVVDALFEEDADDGLDSDENIDDPDSLLDGAADEDDEP